MTKKLRKPRSISEVKAFDKLVITTFFERTIKNLKKRGGDVIISGTTQKEILNQEKDYVNNITSQNIKDARSGKTPLFLNLDPIIFNSGFVDSGVPYLKVRVTG